MKQAHAMLADGQIQLEADYAYKDYIRAIPGRQWSPEQKLWLLPDNPQSLEALRGIGGIQLDQALTERLTLLQRQPVSAGEALPDQPELPPPVRAKLYAHQVKGYNLGLRLKQAALLCEQGTGKSLTALAIAGRRYLNGEVQRLLIVAPLSVLPVWPREFADYADFPHQVTLLSGSSRQKAAQLLTPPGAGLQVMLVNYESAWRIEAELAAWNPDMVICDESQRIKTHDSKQSKALHRLGRAATYRLILTGTPVTNSPLDFWSQYRFLAPELFPASYYAFRNRYAVLGGYSGKEVLAYKNLDELTATAHSVAYRVTKAQALDLPETVDQTLYCDLEVPARRLYDDLRKSRVAELAAGQQVTAPEIIVQLLRLSQLCGGYLKSDEQEREQKVSTAKLKLLRDVLGDLLAAGKKVVVFARFRAEIADICRTAEEFTGEGWRAIWGDVPAAERGEAVAAFQNDPGVKIFIAQIQTAGLGITLTAADTAIFYSLDYSYANYEQAKARIHRIGQRNACTYLHLLARDTVDEKVLQALLHKRDLAADIVDRWQEVFGLAG